MTRTRLIAGHFNNNNKIDDEDNRVDYDPDDNNNKVGVDDVSSKENNTASVAALLTGRPPAPSGHLDTFRTLVLHEGVRGAGAYRVAGGYRGPAPHQTHPGEVSYYVAEPGEAADDTRTVASNVMLVDKWGRDRGRPFSSDVLLAHHAPHPAIPELDLVPPPPPRPLPAHASPPGRSNLIIVPSGPSDGYAAPVAPAAPAASGPAPGDLHLVPSWYSTKDPDNAASSVSLVPSGGREEHVCGIS